MFSWVVENVKWYECDVTDPKSIAEVGKQVRIDVSALTERLGG